MTTEYSEDCCFNDIRDLCPLNTRPCACACHKQQQRRPRCFCPCHEYPGVYAPPCGYCGHDTRQGTFPGTIRDGWVPNAG